MNNQELLAQLRKQSSDTIQACNKQLNNIIHSRTDITKDIHAVIHPLTEDKHELIITGYHTACDIDTHALYEHPEHNFKITEYVIGYCVTLVEKATKKALKRIACNNQLSAQDLIQTIKSDYKDNKIQHAGYFNNVAIGVKA